MQNLTKFTAGHGAQESTFSRGYFLNMVKDNKDDYVNYKSDSLENVSEEKVLEMEVVEILERLGFPINEVGTYLFRDMIVKAIHELDGYDAFGREITQEELLQQMKKPFSQFYVDIARNELDIGIKTFHSHIERLLEDFDYSNAETALLLELYSNFSEETDYGEHAFIIAKHIREVKRKETGHQYCKTVSMMPVEQVSI